jgi:hypothetical protein
MDEMKNYFENSMNNIAFDQIISDIQKNFKNDKAINFIFKKRFLNKDLLIKIMFKPNTKYNPFDTILSFNIELDKDFPESIPYVSMVSNVIFFRKKLLGFSSYFV